MVDEKGRSAWNDHLAFDLSSERDRRNDTISLVEASRTEPNRTEP